MGKIFSAAAAAAGPAARSLAAAAGPAAAGPKAAKTRRKKRPGKQFCHSRRRFTEVAWAYLLAIGFLAACRPRCVPLGQFACRPYKATVSGHPPREAVLPQQAALNYGSWAFLSVVARSPRSGKHRCKPYRATVSANPIPCKAYLACKPYRATVSGQLPQGRLCRTASGERWPSTWGDTGGLGCSHPGCCACGFWLFPGKCFFTHQAPAPHNAHITPLKSQRSPSWPFPGLPWPFSQESTSQPTGRQRPRAHTSIPTLAFAGFLALPWPWPKERQQRTQASSSNAYQLPWLVTLSVGLPGLPLAFPGLGPRNRSSAHRSGATLASVTLPGLRLCWPSWPSLSLPWPWPKDQQRPHSVVRMLLLCVQLTPNAVLGL